MTPFNTCAHRHRHDGDGDVLGDPEDLHFRSDSGEIAHREARVGDEEESHCSIGAARGELLADETPETLAREHAEPGTHLLDHHVRHGDEQHQEKGAIPELQAGARICENPTGAVPGIGFDETRTENGENGEQADDPSLLVRGALDTGDSNVVSVTTGHPDGAVRRAGAIALA